jgi:hypothetical protein
MPCKTALNWSRCTGPKNNQLQSATTSYNQLQPATTSDCMLRLSTFFGNRHRTALRVHKFPCTPGISLRTCCGGFGAKGPAGLQQHSKQGGRSSQAEDRHSCLLRCMCTCKLTIWPYAAHLLWRVRGTRSRPAAAQHLGRIGAGRGADKKA